MPWDSRLPLMGQQFDARQVLDSAEQGQRIAGAARQMGYQEEAHQRGLADIANQQARQSELRTILGRGGKLQDLVGAGFIGEADKISEVQKRQADIGRAQGESSASLRKEQEEMRTRIATGMHGSSRETWSAQADTVAKDIQDELIRSGATPETAEAYATQIRGGLGDWTPEKARIYTNQVVSPKDQANMTNENEQKRLDRENRTTNAGIIAGQKNAAEATKADSDAQKSATDLRKEISARAEIKKYRQASAELSSLKELAKDSSGANDMALVFAFMKAMDPESVVRESEYAAAAATGTPDQRMMGLVSKYWTGGPLSAGQRQAFIKAAEAAQSGHKKAHDTAIKTYRHIASKRNFDLVELGIDSEFPKVGPHGATVTQGDHTFTWNSETGNYE